MARLRDVIAVKATRRASASAILLARRPSAKHRNAKQSPTYPVGRLWRIGHGRFAPSLVSVTFAEVRIVMRMVRVRHEDRC